MDKAVSRPSPRSPTQKAEMLNPARAQKVINLSLMIISQNREIIGKMNLSNKPQWIYNID